MPIFIHNYFFLSWRNFSKYLFCYIQKNEWIIDGNYGSTIELRLQACDTVIFLDYPLEVCLSGIRERRGKARPDMPWIENEDEEDIEFIEFIKNYNSQSRPQVMVLLDKYSYKDIHIFKNRNEADEFLNKVHSFYSGSIWTGEIHKFSYSNRKVWVAFLVFIR